MCNYSLKFWIPLLTPLNITSGRSLSQSSARCSHCSDRKTFDSELWRKRCPQHGARSPVRACLCPVASGASCLPEWGGTICLLWPRLLGSSRKLKALIWIFQKLYRNLKEKVIKRRGGAVWQLNYTGHSMGWIIKQRRIFEIGPS